jgi:hypothetical protein
MECSCVTCCQPPVPSTDPARTIKARAIDNARYCPGSPAASGTSAAATIVQVAASGPTIIWRDEPRHAVCNEGKDARIDTEDGRKARKLRVGHGGRYFDCGARKPGKQIEPHCIEPG